MNVPLQANPPSIAPIQMLYENTAGPIYMYVTYVLTVI